MSGIRALNGQRGIVNDEISPSGAGSQLPFASPESDEARENERSSGDVAPLSVTL